MGERNITLLVDLYQITMMQGYFDSKRHNKKAVFDLFYRKNPSSNGFAIFAGLQLAMEYIKNLKFTEEDINYLGSLKIFKKDFLNYLLDFKFTGDILSVPEGTIVFPNEPIVRVTAPIIEAQFIETAMLNIINHQSLIATKASRIKWAAGSDAVMEFGLRRAQGPDAGIYGARAAVIGGCDSTSNVLAGKMFDIPVSGTHAHSWVMSFSNEIDAFFEYAKLYPDSCILLVDTYDTLKTGVPNAIKVFEYYRDNNIPLGKFGIRLDSGDLAYLSKQARKMLDDAGFKDADICGSSDLDEYLINDLKIQNAKINVWGVGTNLITSYDCPAFGGVYKLSAEEDNSGNMEPKMKISENPDKVTNPGVKKITRIYDVHTNKIKADLISLENETIDTEKSLTIFDPSATWKNMTFNMREYRVRELYITVYKDGKAVYKTPSTNEIKQYCKSELDSLWDEHKRLINPHIVPIDLSYGLYTLKQSMIKKIRG